MKNFLDIFECNLYGAKKKVHQEIFGEKVYKNFHLTKLSPPPGAK